MDNAKFKEILKQYIREQGVEFGMGLMAEIAEAVLDQVKDPTDRGDRPDYGQLFQFSSDGILVAVARGCTVKPLNVAIGVTIENCKEHLPDVRSIEIDGN